MTIVFIGDIHQQWHSVERGLASLDPLPQAAILLGDIQCDRPLDDLAAPLLDRGIDVHWIFGNHDNDGGPEMWANLVEPDRNPRTTQGALHARVVEIAGVRIAGLGGTFRPRIWEPPEPPRLHRRAQLPDDLAASQLARGTHRRADPFTRRHRDLAGGLRLPRRPARRHPGDARGAAQPSRPATRRSTHWRAPWVPA